MPSHTRSPSKDPAHASAQTAPEELAAIEALVSHQRQLDEDGVFVGVSRQAIEVIVAAVRRLQAERAAAPPVGQTVEQAIDRLMNASHDGDEVAVIGGLHADLLRAITARDAAAPPVGQTVEQPIRPRGAALTAKESLAVLATLKDSKSFARGLWGGITIGPLGCDDVEAGITARDAEVARAAEAKILRDVASALQKMAPEIAAKLVEGWRIATGEELLEALRAPAPAEEG